MRNVLCLLAALAFPRLAQAQVLNLGSSPHGSIGHDVSVAIAKLMAERGEIEIRVEPYSGSSAVLPLVNAGVLDFAVCNVLEIQEATAGEGPYKGRQQKNLRVMAAIFPLYVGIFVRKYSPIQTIADLRGKRIPYGFSAQLTVERTIDAVLASGGVERKEVVPVRVPNVVRGAEAFIEGRIDGGFSAIGSAKVLEVHKSTGGIRFLPLSDDPKAVAAMQKHMPFGYIAEVKPGPAFAGIDVSTKLIAYDYVFVVGAHVGDDVAYRIAKSMFENKPKLVESLGAFAGFNPKQMNKKMPAAFHPGAVKLYKEKGIGK